jgi:hypothetical protein
VLLPLPLLLLLLRCCWVCPVLLLYLPACRTYHYNEQDEEAAAPNRYQPPTKPVGRAAHLLKEEANRRALRKQGNAAEDFRAEQARISAAIEQTAYYKKIDAEIAAEVAEEEARQAAAEVEKERRRRLGYLFG